MGSLQHSVCVTNATHAKSHASFWQHRRQPITNYMRKTFHWATWSLTWIFLSQTYRILWFRLDGMNWMEIRCRIWWYINFVLHLRLSISVCLCVYSYVAAERKRLIIVASTIYAKTCYPIPKWKDVGKTPLILSISPWQHDKLYPFCKIFMEIL